MRGELKEGRAERRRRSADDSRGPRRVDLLWLDGTPLLDVPLLERRRLLESVVTETDLVRRGAFVRPPIDTLGRIVAVAGVRGPHVQGGQQPLPAGRRGPDWASIAMPRR